MHKFDNVHGTLISLFFLQTGPWKWHQTQMLLSVLTAPVLRSLHGQWRLEDRLAAPGCIGPGAIQLADRDWTQVALEDEDRKQRCQTSSASDSQRVGSHLPRGTWAVFVLTSIASANSCKMAIWRLRGSSGTAFTEAGGQNQQWELNADVSKKWSK